MRKNERSFVAGLLTYMVVSNIEELFFNDGLTTCEVVKTLVVSVVSAAITLAIIIPILRYIHKRRQR